MNLTPAMRRALRFLRARGRLGWETDNPPFDRETNSTVSRATLDALVRRGLATVEVSGRDVPGQRIPKRWGRTWRRGYYHAVRVYRPTVKEAT